MRYCDAQNSERMVADGTQYWMPMDQYIGGIEHAILHLLYARFWTKVMRDMGMVKFDEPFTRLLTQGMVLNHIFFRKGEKGGIEYFPPDEVTMLHDAEGRINGANAKRDGKPVEYGGVGTMSKSKLNGVDPQQIIDRYGADTARLYVMFAGPPEETALWSDAGVEGAFRFLKRLWSFAQTHAKIIRQGAPAAAPAPGASSSSARREVHLALKQVNYDYHRIQYNTVVSGAMKVLNALEGMAPADAGWQAALHEGVSILLRVLYPVAPHITHELWEQLGYAQALGGEILNAPWPEVSAEALAQDEIELVLQINGKLRGHIRVAADAAKEAIEAAALASEEFKRHAGDAKPRKMIVVPGRLVNVVL
jgi:leucyl-tRNA synthetase